MLLDNKRGVDSVRKRTEEVVKQNTTSQLTLSPPKVSKKLVIVLLSDFVGLKIGNGILSISV